MRMRIYPRRWNYHGGAGTEVPADGIAAQGSAELQTNMCYLPRNGWIWENDVCSGITHINMHAHSCWPCLESCKLIKISLHVCNITASSSPDWVERMAPRSLRVGVVPQLTFMLARIHLMS